MKVFVFIHAQVRPIALGRCAPPPRGGDIFLHMPPFRTVPFGEYGGRQLSYIEKFCTFPIEK